MLQKLIPLYAATLCKVKEDDKLGFNLKSKKNPR
jgi:hypothetical protein